jgi:hypothetical protein
MPQKVVIVLLLAEIIHGTLLELIKNILLKLQKNNIFVINKEYEFIPRGYRAGSKGY